MKPRLLVIINRFVIGGQAADTIPLLYNLQHKYTIRVIYGEKEADEIAPLFLLEQYGGLDLEKMPSLKRSVNPFADMMSLYRMYRCIKNFRPDIVHTHGAKSGFAGRIAARMWGKAVVVHTFHGHLFHSYFNTFTTKAVIQTEKWLAKFTDAAIALSPSQQKELTEKFKILPPGKVVEIPLGIEPPLEQVHYKNSLRRQYQLEADDVAIGIIGRIVPIKNHPDFLKVAISIISKGVKNAKFFVIGDGNGRHELIEVLKQHNIRFSLPGESHEDARVIFTSWIANMYEAIYDLDIVALTSLNEGTPVSLIEAQLCGKPVVAYNVGGVKDTFIDKDSGFLVEKGDVAAFADALTVLIYDEQLRTCMGARGKEYSSALFSKQQEVALIDGLYNRLLQEKKRKHT